MRHLILTMCSASMFYMKRQYQKIQPSAYLYLCIKCFLIYCSKKSNSKKEESRPNNWLPSGLINDAGFNSVFCSKFNV